MTENLTLLQLLARARGHIESTAKQRKVIIMREVDAEHTKVMLVDLNKMLKTGIDVPIRAGDVVYLPRKTMVELNEWVNRFTGTISPLLNLYNLAFETYYTDNQFRQLYDSDDSPDVVVLKSQQQEANQVFPIIANP
jgi:hypothetical protein